MTDAVSHLLPGLKPLGACENFDALVGLCAGVAAGKKAPADAHRTGAAAGVDAGCTDSLVAFFLEAARRAVPTEALTAALNSVLPGERARNIASIAAEGQPFIASALSAVASGPDELVDVSWTRVGTAAAGSERPRAGGDPRYTVTLTTRRADGSAAPVQFIASLEQLNDLVASLKAAVHQVELDAPAL